MKAAYVGILTPGSTSRMRAETLRGLTPHWDWQWIDTDIPMTRSTRVWQTAAFRLNWGAAVKRINRLVADETNDSRFDLVWVDKAVFLYRRTIQQLRARTERLVHFTPDTAFHQNRSRHFNASMQYFDLVVTTKSFELAEYRHNLPGDRVLLVTQGFDSRIHYPRAEPNTRKREAVFVGLAEPDRERCIDTLLKNGISVRLAGRGWAEFVSKRSHDSRLTFAGDAVFGDDYASLVSHAWVGLGLLSKRFPELHTTRTFEIPACGAILATERTADTEQFFSDSEAIFFEDYADLAKKLRTLMETPGDEVLASVAHAGMKRVSIDGRNYSTILAQILADERLT